MIFGGAALALTAAITITLLIFFELPWLPTYLIAINTVTFVAYAYDKRAASKSKQRTPENTLHILALIGGSPAAFLAQQTLRHKTAKRSFQLTCWAIVILQVALLVYLLT